MEKITKKRLIIGAIILLLVINISALATIYYTSKVRTRKIVEYNKMQEQAHMNSMQNYFRNELKLSDTQFQKFRKINHSYLSKSRDIIENLNIERHDMMTEIANINPNNENLDHIAREIGDQHYALKKHTINHFLELKKLCNPEQQIVLQKMFMHMIYTQDPDNMGRRKRHGRRNQGNRQDKPRNKKSGRKHSGRR